MYFLYDVNMQYEIFIFLLAGYIASLYMAWNIGSNDASNPTAAVVGSNVLRINQALLLFTISAGMGALVQGWMVMKTLGEGILLEIDILGAIAAILAASLWIITASYHGMPISTSQSISSAVLGVGLAYVYLNCINMSDINWGIIYNIILSWITSPLISMSMAILLYFMFKKITGAVGNEETKANLYFKTFLILALMFSAYSFGANDVGNATGVYYTITSKYFSLSIIETRILLALLGTLGIALGGFTLGRRVISTVAYKITGLDLISGLAAEYANALTVWLFTTIPYLLLGYGMPISTTHASVSAIIGVGIAKNKGLRGINIRIIILILLSWLLTLPATVSIAFILRVMFQKILC
jgi:PiT family inorganic phosphate transporter